MADFIFEAGVGILKWLFDAFAANIVLPAVVRAANAIVLDKAVIK